MNAPSLVRAFAAGAGLMYLLDPQRGRRRRAQIRDRAAHLRKEANDMLDTTSRDLRHRAEGLASKAKLSNLRGRKVSEHVLEARVRSAMGRAVSHPSSIQVIVDGSGVQLAGPILAHEVAPLLSAVRSVKGIKRVEDQLDVHKEPGTVPGLQGGRVRQGRRPELLQTNWAPAARFLVGAIGSGMILRGAFRGGLLGKGVAAAGAGLLTRAIANLEWKRLLGMGAGRRAVDLTKTVHVDASPEEVFAFWDNVENFPRFMSHLREVRSTGDGRSHWVAEGRGGMRAEWDAEITARVPNEVIAWKSIGKPAIENAGLVRFQPDERGGTRIDIRMSYNPPAGALGHAFASFLGANPKHLMNEDMVRLQSLIERGKTSAHGHEVSRDEMLGMSTT